MGVLKERTGSFQQGLLLLALISLAGAALALWMRRSPILRGEQPRCGRIQLAAAARERPTSTAIPRHRPWVNRR